MITFYGYIIKYKNIYRRCIMDWASWALLAIALIYWLFNIKKIYLFVVWTLHENRIIFNIGLFLLVAIFISGLILAFAAPQYGWIPQWALIWYIVGFFIYRIFFGVRDKES